MNQHHKKFILLFVLIGCLSAYAEVAIPGKTFFEQNTQGINLARWESGQYHQLYRYTNHFNYAVSITPFYSQTFSNREIGQWFFFNGSNTMSFGPAYSIAKDDHVDVFARNFFMNDNFYGQVTANPTSKNFILDINCYVGLDKWIQGLYARVDVPINWTSWDMSLTESVFFVGSGIAVDKLGNSTNTISAPNKSIIEAWKGTNLDIANFPAIKQPMFFGKINGKQTKIGVADVTFILGYNFINNKYAHLGCNIWAVAPTGTRPNAQYVFEPVIGNGHHVAVGTGFTSHYELWHNEHDASFGMLFEGYMLHLFKTKQTRTFDLKANGVGSRYLLFKRFNPDGTNSGEIVFGPNILTKKINVYNDFIGEALLMFNYQNGGFTFDAGYNIWGRTHDKITLLESVPPNTFAAQGNRSSSIFDPTSQNLSIINGTFLPLPPSIESFISTDSINIDSAVHPGCYSNRIFMHFAYTWLNHIYMPFIGIGGQIEFSGKNNSAFNLWGIWIKSGISF